MIRSIWIKGRRGIWIGPIDVSIVFSRMILFGLYSSGLVCSKFERIFLKPPLENVRVFYMGEFQAAAYFLRALVHIKYRQCRKGRTLTWKHLIHSLYCIDARKIYVRMLVTIGSLSSDVFDSTVELAQAVKNSTYSFVGSIKIIFLLIVYSMKILWLKTVQCLNFFTHFYGKSRGATNHDQRGT